jgi:2-polyprenyl-3-methyl-5-hydroxy-6-metoxy-1,4-benzoquinol methylase
MPFFLSQRKLHSREYMDDPECNREMLFNTYRQFAMINAAIAGWKRIYQTHIKPLLNEVVQPCSLLDIGFGGGDIPLKLAKWAAEDGFLLHITAIDTDPRAMEYVKSLSVPSNVTFLHCSAVELLSIGGKFDLVISNHLLHHLNPDELKQLLNQSKKLSKGKVLFNDIERNDIGYGLFSLITLPFPYSFIREDGLISIKRSYTFRELKKHIPADWEVRRQFPFRLLLSYTH